mmetsp:Transcript_8752/g.19415  ORF Transcript_8752/g.19415 Transcript_8752/m.19415 type:complete len:221 (+) Transcript_8752:220-882(+)
MRRKSSSEMENSSLETSNGKTLGAFGDSPSDVRKASEVPAPRPNNASISSPSSAKSDSKMCECLARFQKSSSAFEVRSSVGMEGLDGTPPHPSRLGPRFEKGVSSKSTSSTTKRCLEKGPPCSEGSCATKDGGSSVSSPMDVLCFILSVPRACEQSDVSHFVSTLPGMQEKLLSSDSRGFARPFRLASLVPGSSSAKIVALCKDAGASSARLPLMVETRS